jgi:pimeloyl-ACP methyl ester carboxylesterase
MVAQYLAGLHPDAVGCLALVGSGLEVSDWGKDVDRRLAEAVAGGDHVAAGAAFAEYVLPSKRAERLRRRLGPMLAKPILTSPAYPPGDLLVELEAEMACDCRPVLPRIEAPTLVIAGGRDRFFPKDIVDETADLIKECAVVRYPGKGHVRTCSTARAARDVLHFVGRSRSPA